MKRCLIIGILQKSEASHKPSALNNGFPYKHLRTIGHGQYSGNQEDRHENDLWHCMYYFILGGNDWGDFMNHECKTFCKYVVL